MNDDLVLFTAYLELKETKQSIWSSEHHPYTLHDDRQTESNVQKNSNVKITWRQTTSISVSYFLKDAEHMQFVAVWLIISQHFLHCAEMCVRACVN